MKSDPNGPELSQALEMQRRMTWILFEQDEVLAREALNLRRQFREEAPETFGCAVAQISLVSPRSCSASASAANLSSFPAATSCSN